MARLRRDPHYVRLPIIEEELKNYLNNGGSGDEAVRLVLLYGRAGSGKSSMARNLALDYKEAATADGSASNGTNGCRKFDDVLYVECGPEANSKDKQVELFGMLDWERCSDAEKEKYRDLEKVEPMLKQWLKGRRSLIIFDDVREGTFLKDMVGVCGEHTRVLVTSQKTSLCEDSLIESAKSVPMDQITKEDSFKVLKAHTEFCDEDDIPEAVKECMCYLVTKVCGNPHALASIAVAIDTKHRQQVQQWENVIREYDKLVHDSLSKHSMNSLHDVQYQRSCMESAIQVKFGRLTDEEKKVLIFMVMIRGILVPEEILQLFYGEIMVQNNFEGVRSCTCLSNVRKQLEDLQCIRTGEYKREMSQFNYSDHDHEQRFGWRTKFEGICWSIHNLDEQFIERRMTSDIDAMLEVVKHLPNKTQGLEAEPQVHVAKLLGFLFFKAPFNKRIVSSLNPNYSASFSGDILSCTHGHILPVIGLMTKSVGENWSITSQKASDQTVLSCIADSVVHNDAAKELLNSPLSKHQFWTLIGRWRWRMGRGSSIHEDVIIGVLRIFGDLLLSMNNSVIVSLNPEQWNALLVLVSRTPLWPARSCVLNVRKLALGLLEMVTSSSSPRNIKHRSAMVLSYLVPLMYERSSEYGEEGLASIPIIIEELVHSVKEYSDREVHEGATRALSALVFRSHANVKQKMISIGFHALVNNLEKEEDEELQGLALGILEDLVFGNSTRDRIYRGLDYNRIQISASMIQDLSNCLATIIARDPAEGNAWGYKGDAVELLMKIDPVRGKSMIRHSSHKGQARGAELVEQGDTRMV